MNDMDARTRGRGRPALLQRAGAFLPKPKVAPFLWYPFGDRDYPTYPKGGGTFR